MPESCDVFFPTEDFLAGISALNRMASETDAAAALFRQLLQEDFGCTNSTRSNTDSCGNNTSSCHGTSCSCSSHVVSTLAAILDRVAYFPLRPSDMQVR
jgi:hypothetical protein